MPRLAWWNGDKLVMDGEIREPGGLPRGKTWSNETVYLLGEPRWRDLVRSYLRRGDTVCGPVIGRVEGADVQCSKGKYRISSASAWDLPHTPEAAEARIEELEEAMAEEGWYRWPATAGVLASQLSRAFMPDLSQLRTRWRFRSHDGLHQGPTVALKGGAERAWYLDRKGAYLAELAEPMPVASSWASVARGTSWNALKRHEGIVTAQVEIDVFEAAGKPLPPLPVRGTLGTAWPVGVATGTWPIRWLAWAEKEAGVTVHEVLDAQVCKTAPIALPLHDRIDRIGHKGLRRLIYTRAWGGWAALGWFHAGFVETTTGRHYRYAGKDTWWEPRRGTLLNHLHPPTYHPDMAAWVAGGNALKLAQAMHRLKRGEAVMAHIDAVVVTSEDARDRLVKDQGEWSIKGNPGIPIRVYGVGTYEYGSKVAAMGWPAWKPLERTRLAEHVDSQAFGVRRLQKWHGDPSRTAEAEAEPRFAEELPGYGSGPAEPPAYPTWDATLWTKSGWYRGEEVPEDPPPRVETELGTEATQVIHSLLRRGSPVRRSET